MIRGATLKLRKLLFKLLCCKKIFFVYFAGVVIFSCMVMLEAINISNRQYHSIFKWLTNESVLLLLIFFLALHLYNTYKNCLYFISPDINVFIHLGIKNKKIKVYLQQLFALSTIIVMMLSSLIIWILFSINT